MRWMAGLLIALLAGACAQNHAPVVDAPVRDRGATPASAPKGEVVRPSSGAGRSAGGHADGELAPDTYVVKKGDTLYGIALDHGQDYRDIAAWNRLSDPNVISVGQQLRVQPPAGWREPDAEGEAGTPVVTRPIAPPSPVDARPLEEATPLPLKKGPKAMKVPYSDKAFAAMGGVPEPPPVSASGQPERTAAELKPVTEPRAPGEAKTAAPAVAGPVPAVAPPPQVARPASAPAPGSAAGAPAATSGKPGAQPAANPPAPANAKAAAATGWAWPARGKVVHEFGKGPNPKGITLAGEFGEAVWASAAGKVVYSGSGLRGYGKLVIIKHDAQFLSVYAHNRELLVKEGERVQKGQKIAEMGGSDTGRAGLHFEIRKLGKPVDPLPFLAPGSG